MTTTFAQEALEEYHEAARYSEARFGMGRQFVASMQAALAAIKRRHPAFKRSAKVSASSE